MTNEEYIQAVKRSESLYFHVDNVNVRTLHAILGIATEGAGEALDSIKKSLFYNTPFNRKNLKEELGDILWYIAIACDDNGWTLNEVMEANIRKLKVRYPKQFTEENAKHRNTDKEMDVL